MRIHLPSRPTGSGILTKTCGARISGKSGMRKRHHTPGLMHLRGSLRPVSCAVLAVWSGEPQQDGQISRGLKSGYGFDNRNERQKVERIPKGAQKHLG